MTREEAIAKVSKVMNGVHLAGYPLAPQIVDALQALGLVTFAPPKDAIFRFVGAYNGHKAKSGDISIFVDTHEVRAALKAAGLEIVEKK